MSKIDNVLKGYKSSFNKNEIKSQIEKIATEAKKNETKNVEKLCFSCIDLTSLNHTDNEKNITEFVEKVNNLNKIYKDLDNVAAICVYPNMITTVKEKLIDSNINIATVVGFPMGQTFTEIKIAETGMCIMEGATEIDMVISVGKFLNKEYEEIAEEIQEIKESCRDKKLKVILETGSLLNIENIYIASVIAMEAGADFIKTSTGKTQPSATPEAFYMMCLAIKEFYKKTNMKVGIKVAGGVSTTEDTVLYYSIVKEVLGKEWLNNKLFRIGTSKLANVLLSSIYKKEEKYF